MDKLLLNALDNLSVALEMLSESLDKKGAAKSDVGASMQSGDFGKQIEEINNGIKSIKNDTSKILDNTETIIKLQKEKKDKGGIFESAGKDSNKKMLKDGVSIIALIAGSVLAIGLAFKLIGSVDWVSVIAISLALPLMAYAFERVAKVKDITPAKVAMIGLALVGMALAITASSWILSMVKPVGLFQLITVVFIAAAFGAASVGLGYLIKGFKNISAVDALKASKVLPIVLLAVSIAIAASSRVLQAVRPIGLFQALTAILIAAAFGAISFGLGKLIASFKGIDPATALVASVVMPIVMIALSFAIVGASWWFSLIRPIGLFQALTAIFIAAVFVVLAYAVKPLLQGVKGVEYKDMLKGGAVIVVLSAAVVAASWLLKLMPDIDFGTIIKFGIMGVALAITTVVMAGAIKVVNTFGDPASYFEGGISVVIIAGAIAISSQILALGNYANYPELSWALGVGLSLAAFGLGAVLLGTQVLDPFFYGGLAMILVVAASIVATDLILGLGSYSRYPSIDWALGVGLSLAAFGLGAVLLGTQVLDPFFYGGLAMILVVAASIVATDLILGLGSYSRYPSIDWVIPTMLVIGSFGVIASALSLVSPFILVGSIAILMIVGTIYLIDKIFSGGGFKKYPDDNWVNSVTHVIDRMAHIISDIRKKISFKDLVIGSIKIMSVVGTIYLIDKIFSGGKFKKYPDDKWMNGVTHVIDKMASVIIRVRKTVGFADLVLGSLKVLGVITTIRLIDDILNGGIFKRYPSKEWVDGVKYSILEFIGLMNSSDFLAIVGQKIASFFGGGLDDVASSIVGVSKVISMGKYNIFPSRDWVYGVVGSMKGFQELGNPGFFSSLSSLFGDDNNATITKLANQILEIDKVISNGDFSKFPQRAWVDGTIYALQKFKEIINSLSFGDIVGGLFKLVGDKSPLEQAVDNITLLAIAFDKLGNTMNTFSQSIQSLDAEKLQMVKGLTSNVILLSLMDPEMFDQMMDKLEKRGGVFNDLIKDFEEKKEGSKSSGTVKAAVSATSQGKSDSQVLGEKVDRMTAILADISSVVGSGGALKTYLNSIKDKQLHGSSNAPSTHRSDKRLKNIIRKIGESTLGLNIYLFTYTFNPKVIYQGVMAQELLDTPYENALITDKNGFYQVDYSKIDVEFKKVTTFQDF